MKPEELARMRNPLNRKNVNRIRNLLNKIDFCISTRSRDAVETDDWFREIADELGACRAILFEERRRRNKKGGKNRKARERKE